MKQTNTILIVDDSPLIIKRLNALLNRIENVDTVLQAKSFAEAIELLMKNNIQIALLDIHLKDKSGLDILKYIREENLTIVVLMLTNQADSEYHELCMKLGADHFLDKSKDFALIPSIVSSIL